MHINHIFMHREWRLCPRWLEEAGLVQNSWTIRLSVSRRVSRGGPSGAGEAAAAAEGRGGRWLGGAGRPGRRPGVAIPGRMRMSLRAMKSAQVGLPRIVQEQPATGLARIDPHKYA